MRGDGAAARLVSNSRWNVVAFVVSLAANFLALPIAIAAVGVDAYGAAGLVLAIYAPFTLVGTVLGQAIVRELAPRIAGGDHAGCARIVSAAFALAAIGCAAVTVTLSLAGRPLLTLMTGQSTLDDGSWRVAFVICGVGWVAQQGCLLLQSAVAATQRYGRLALASSVSAVVGSLALIGAAQAMPDAEGFLLGTAAGFALTLLFLVTLLWRDIGWLLRISRWQRDDVAVLLEFGRWQGAAHFAGAVGNQADRYALGALAPLTAVGQYNLAMRLQEVVHMGVLKMTEVLFPHFSVTAGEALDKRAAFFLRASWSINLIAVALLAPLMPLAAPLITLWVDVAAADGAAPMLRTLALAGVIGAGINVYFYFAMASGQMRRIAVMTAVHAVILVVATVLLIRTLGPVAAGVGYVLANAVRLALAVRLSAGYFSDCLSLPVVLAGTILPLLGGLAAASAVHLLMQPTADGWIVLASQYAACAAFIALAATSFTATTNAGRQLLREVLVSTRALRAQRRR